MARAVIISGDEERHVRQARAFEQYLMEMACICNIVSLSAHEYENDADFFEALRAAFLAPLGEPLLVVYIGHGSETGWHYASSRMICYDALSVLLSQVEAPVLVLNDCCHAGTIEKALKQTPQPEARGIILACKDNEVSFGFSQTVLDAWSKEEVFCPEVHGRKVIYCGEMVKMAKPTEVVVGGLPALLRHKVGLFLHRRFPNYFGPPWLKILVIFPENLPTSPKEIEREVPHVPEMRSGEILDHYFFPKTVQREFQFD